jgi:hypothetical protein
LDENLQITLTSLARYSLTLEIQMSIPKPFEKFYSFFFLKKKKPDIFYASFTLQKPHRMQDFVSTFSKIPLTRLTALRCSHGLVRTLED